MKFFAATMVSLLFFHLFPAYLHSFCFEEAGKKYNISPRLLMGIARVESGLNPRALNKNPNGSTDMGLMQINSAWLKTLKVTGDDLMNDACLNTMTGAWVLRQCVDRFGYTWEAVGCYNAYSKEKRVNYAWKVFHKLKGTGDATAPRETLTGKTAMAAKNQKPRRSSFVFHARDVTDREWTTP